MARDFTTDSNRHAARAWGYCGAHWEEIAFGLSDALSWAVQSLGPAPGERILDIGTGSGWAARLAAGRGARVTGVDFSAGMIDAARQGSAHLADRLDFVQAEAEALPFGDASFDAIVSTYGVIFAADPDAAAAEMARVLRPGGRMVLATWADRPDSYIPRFFTLVGSYSDGPPPAASPLDWGRRDRLEALLGDRFDLAVDEVATQLFAPDCGSVWRKYIAGFGPMALAAEALSPERRASFEADFEALHAPFERNGQLRITRDALLVRGRRR